MPPISGINQALAIRNEPAQLSIAAALLKQQLDATQTTGGAIVELLQQSEQLGRKIDIRV